ncbi:hypothetical protein HK102_011086 [Quaeritorhiza haematococci]|nr:hypothetical protein HK102_011086 [Quaeritorhiza haematococci]
MPPKPLKISKADISHPIQLNQSPAFADSGVALPVEVISSPQGPAIEPFSNGRFDSSASVAGGPNDPRMIRANQPPPTLTLRQFQSFVQALGAFRRQVQAMSAASETFVRALEEMAEYVPAAELSKPYVVGDLDFLIDSTHLIANAHQIWAESLERDFEAPLMAKISDICKQVKITQQDNKNKINQLVEQLHKEEDSSYKLGKKKQRDLVTLQTVSTESEGGTVGRWEGGTVEASLNDLEY